MANLPESSTFDSGVYQLETGDAVQGGVNGKSNQPLKNLTNRTKYLKDRVDALEGGAGLSSPVFVGDPRAPTAPIGDEDTSLATTGFVERARAGVATVATTGGNTSLVATEWGARIIVVTGVLESNAALIFPADRTGTWVVFNGCTGPGGGVSIYTLSVKGALADTLGPTVPQGSALHVYGLGNGTIKSAGGGDSSGSGVKPWVVKTAAYSLAATGERLVCNTNGGIFTVTLPPTPAQGYEVTIKGNFAANNLTIERNGNNIAGLSSNLILNKDNLTVNLVFDNSNWRV